MVWFSGSQTWGSAPPNGYKMDLRGRKMTNGAAQKSVICLFMHDSGPFLGCLWVLEAKEITMFENHWHTFASIDNIVNLYKFISCKITISDWKKSDAVMHLLPVPACSPEQDCDTFTQLPPLLIPHSLSAFLPILGKRRWSHPQQSRGRASRFIGQPGPNLAVPSLFEDIRHGEDKCDCTCDETCCHSVTWNACNSRVWVPLPNLCSHM